MFVAQTVGKVRSEAVRETTHTHTQHTTPFNSYYLIGMLSDTNINS